MQIFVGGFSRCHNVIDSCVFFSNRHLYETRCREDFRPQAETRGRQANWRTGAVQRRHIKGIGRLA